MAGHRKLAGTDEVIWNGRKYRRFPDHPNRSSRVYYMATTSPRTYLHRDIYEAHYGPIPDGWHIHHRDHDPLNNDPTNLEAVAPGAHATHHGTRHPEAQRTCPACGQDFTASRPWSIWCSARCKERARRAAGLVQPKPRLGKFSELRTCEECLAEYQATKPWQRFCCSACKQRWGRRNR